MKKYTLVATCLIFCSLHAMEKSTEDRERKEREFEARMLAMRAEQAKRATNQQFTFKQEQSEIPGVGTVHSGSIDFGEGISLEEFKKIFTGAQAECEREMPQQKDEKRAQQSNSNHVVPGTVFMTDLNREEFNEMQRQKGFHVYPEPDGIVFFCKPGYGHEEHRAEHLAAYRAMRKARGK